MSFDSAIFWWCVGHWATMAVFLVDSLLHWNARLADGGLYGWCVKLILWLGVGLFAWPLLVGLIVRSYFRSGARTCAECSE